MPKFFETSCSAEPAEYNNKQGSDHSLPMTLVKTGWCSCIDLATSISPNLVLRLGDGKQTVPTLGGVEAIGLLDMPFPAPREL